MTFIDKPKRKQAPTRPMQTFWLAGFVFLCAAMIGFMLLTANNDYVTCFDTPFPSVQGVEHHAFFTLPPSAQNFEYAAEGAGKGCTIWASFEMNSEDVESFQASTRVPPFLSRTIRGVLLQFMQKQGWPQPDNALVSAAHISDDPYIDQWIVLDTKDTNAVAVYLIVFKGSRA